MCLIIELKFGGTILRNIFSVICGLSYRVSQRCDCLGLLGASAVVVAQNCSCIGERRLKAGYVGHVRSAASRDVDHDTSTVCHAQVFADVPCATKLFKLHYTVEGHREIGQPAVIGLEFNAHQVRKDFRRPPVCISGSGAAVDGFAETRRGLKFAGQFSHHFVARIENCAGGVTSGAGLRFNPSRPPFPGYRSERTLERGEVSKRA